MTRFRKSPEAIVVGGGIAGVMTALHLARRGAKTRLLDKWEPGHSRAASSDYTRILRAIHGRDRFYTRWTREARLRWLELQQEIGATLYYECGALILATEGKCAWEDQTAQTFDELGVPYSRFEPDEIASRFPQFNASSVAYGLYEPEAGMLMAHRGVLAGLELFRREGGDVRRAAVATDADERLMLDGKPLEADVVVVATGAWMADMFPRSVKPISWVMGINVLYTSTPEGDERFDGSRMPCWIDHGEGSFGLPSAEGSGVKAAVVIPHEPIDLDNDERLVRRAALAKTRSYIRKRLPDLVGERVVDSKFNQVIMTIDTNFIVDRHPVHRDVILAGGCSGHLYKHGPVFGDFVAGMALNEYDTADRFRIEGRRRLTPDESPSGR